MEPPAGPPTEAAPETPSAGEPPFLIIGRIVGPAGRRPVLRVVPLTDFPERFQRLQRIYVGEALRPYRVRRAAVHGRYILLELEGVETLAEAERLSGALLWIPRAEAMPLPPGHYYWYQIIGAEVVTTRGESLGQVVEILRTAAHDVYIVHGPRGEVLLPAIEPVIKEVDVVNRRLIVEPPPGLLEETSRPLRPRRTTRSGERGGHSDSPS